MPVDFPGQQTALTRGYNVKTAPLCFEETIGGRSYLIEVRPVDPLRWRAYIVRVPGMPTALMPFYGTTPEEAAAQLRNWLHRAHARAGEAAKPTARAR